MPGYFVDPNLPAAEQSDIASLLTGIAGNATLAAATSPATDTYLSYTDILVSGHSGSYTILPALYDVTTMVHSPPGIPSHSTYIRLSVSPAETFLTADGSSTLSPSRALFHEMMHARFNFFTVDLQGDVHNPWFFGAGNLEEELCIAAENLIYVPVAYGSLTAGNVRIGHQSNYSGSVGTSGALFFSGFGPAALSVQGGIVRFSASNGFGSVSKEYHVPADTIGGEQYTHYILDTIHLNNPLFNASPYGATVASAFFGRFIDSIMHGPEYGSGPNSVTSLTNALAYTLHAPNFASAAGASQTTAVGLGADHFFDASSSGTLDLTGVVTKDNTVPGTIVIDRSASTDGEIIFGAASALGSHDRIFGGSGNDLIISHASHDTGQDQLYGGDGDDLLIASGAAQFHGGAGNDVIVGTDQENLYDGGGDADLLLLSNLGAGVIVDTRSGTVTSENHVSTMTGIEQVAGTPFDDVFWGNPGVIYGGGGADTFHLSDLFGVHGGPGSQVIFDLATGGVSVQLNGNADIEIASLVGSSGNDTIDARSQGMPHATQTVDGAGGDDTILVGSNVVVHGGDGNDTFRLTESGPYVLFGDAGEDTLDFGLSGATTVSVHLVDHTFTSDIGSGVADGFEHYSNPYGKLDITGTAADEIIEGNRKLDAPLGSPGSFAGGSVSGGGGNDLIKGYGFFTFDTFDGGDGDDVIYDFGNGILIGGAGNDQLYGLRQNTLIGGDGDDYLSGLADNCVFSGGSGHNEMHGAGAFDIAEYASMDSLTISGDASHAFIYGAGFSDELFGIEYLRFADTGRLYDMTNHFLL